MPDPPISDFFTRPARAREGILTSDFKLYKPKVGEIGWSEDVNINFDIIDKYLGGSIKYAEDVVLNSPKKGDILIFNGTLWENQPNSIENLTNLDITNLKHNYTIRYIQETPFTGKWITAPFLPGWDLDTNPNPWDIYQNVPVNPADLSKGYIVKPVQPNFLYTNGSNQMLANLNIGNNKIINLSNPTNPLDAVNLQTLENTISKYWLDPIINFFNPFNYGTNVFPLGPADGARYIASVTNGTIAIKNTIYTYSQSKWIPTTPLKGMVVYNKADELLYIFDGTTWTPFEGGSGGIGIPGPEGPQGIPGPAGPVGATGPQGSAGAKGDKGDPFKYSDFTAPQLAALIGPKGDMGNTGPQGPAGTNGKSAYEGAVENGYIGSEISFYTLLANLNTTLTNLTNRLKIVEDKCLPCPCGTCPACPCTSTPSAPVAGFTANTTTGTAPVTITFTDQSTNTPTSWLWNFGDPTSGSNNTSTLQNPTHTYSTAGTYTVTLTATNATGSNTNTKTGYITISAPYVPKPPVANFTTNVTFGTSPLTVTFTDTSTNTPTSWLWDFGNPTSGSSNTSTLQNPSHTYTTAGTYTVKLTATNADGSNTVTKTSLITVSAPYIPTPPVANFTTNITSGTSPLTITFTDTSTNTPTSWSWDFGDPSSGANNTSTSKNPSHTYTTAGTYTVKLTATNADGSDTITKTNLITVSAPYVPTPPVANFSANVTTGDIPLTVVFTDQSTNTPTSWLWTFGDGGTSTSKNPTYVYIAAGTYTVTLKATNADGSDTFTRTGYITVTDPTDVDFDLYFVKPAQNVPNHLTMSTLFLDVNLTVPINDANLLNKINYVTMLGYDETLPQGLELDMERALIRIFQSTSQTGRYVGPGTMVPCETGGEPPLLFPLKAYNYSDANDMGKPGTGGTVMFITTEAYPRALKLEYRPNRNFSGV